MTAKSKKTPQTTFNGALIIDKPVGLTSHDVVSRLRRILRTKKIGHTGTLDPFATGVLVMLVGKATRLARFLDKDRKTYEARLRFGFETDTGDREGKRRGGAKEEGARDEGRGEGFRIQDSGFREGLGTRDEGREEESGSQDSGVSTVGSSRWRSEPPAVAGGANDDEIKIDLPPHAELTKRVSAVLPEFTGEIQQIPPMYSAKKIKGKKLYELAREGIEINRKPCDVTIYELEIIEGGTGDESEINLKVTCSAGTYIRTLAEDIGRRVGIGCHLSALRRIRAGNFDIHKALTIEELEAVAEAGETTGRLISMNDVVSHLPLQRLNENDLKLISHGMKIDARIESDSVQNIRLTNDVDVLVAIGETDASGMIQPKLVLISD